MVAATAGGRGGGDQGVRELGVGAVNVREPNWPRLYSAVLLFLALQIVLFYAFTKAFQ
jgi:hypothetical protein